jgi:hypothetical protein
MKISNTREAMKKVAERAGLIEQRNQLLYREWRVILDSDFGARHVEVTSMVDADAIRKVAIENFNKKIAEIAVELKELGVYVDTEEAVIPPRIMF